VKLPLFALVLVLALPYTTNAATIRVPADQPTIQAAIDAATSGDIVLVAPGAYYEAINFNGKNITVTSELGAAATTTRAADRPSSRSNQVRRATPS
jgi:serine protease